MKKDVVLFSIKPKFANKIFSGEKTAELRRIRPKQVGRGDLALVYVSSPIKSLVGAFEIENIIEAPVESLWQLLKGRAGISFEEFTEYFKGAETGVGILFNSCWQLAEPVELKELREASNTFNPPQSFRYPSEKELSLSFFTKLTSDSLSN
ncbi:MAG: ASCH domain-containing protein [Anaerolineae bacterium]